VRRGRVDHAPHLVGGEREVRVALSLDDPRADDPCDLGMHLVRRLERRHRSAGAGIGEQDRLQHLVRPVGGEHHLGRHAVQRGDRLAQLGGLPVRVAMPLDPRHLGRQRVPPRRGRRER
jgi:hypothetical protein